METLLIESHESDGVEWGISFTTPNPEPEEYVACKTRDDALRLQKILKHIRN